MSEEKELLTLVQVWQDIGANVQVLGIAGVCGALVKACVAPEKQWKRRAAQGFAGVVSAVFLGAFIASFVEGLMSEIVNIETIYVYLASGFVCGAGGESAMGWAQRKILGSQGGDESGNSN